MSDRTKSTSSPSTTTPTSCSRSRPCSRSWGRTSSPRTRVAKRSGCCCSEEFAVVLLDVNMPGWTASRRRRCIRQRKNSEHTPIIFVTAYGDETHASRGYSLGAVDYILAPVDPEVLKTEGRASSSSSSARRPADQLAGAHARANALAAPAAHRSVARDQLGPARSTAMLQVGHRSTRARSSARTRPSRSVGRGPEWTALRRRRFALARYEAGERTPPGPR